MIQYRTKFRVLHWFFFTSLQGLNNFFSSILSNIIFKNIIHISVSHLPLGTQVTRVWVLQVSLSTLFSIHCTSLSAQRCTISIFSLSFLYWLSNCHEILHFRPDQCFIQVHEWFGFNVTEVPVYQQAGSSRLAEARECGAALAISEWTLWSSWVQPFGRSARVWRRPVDQRVKTKAVSHDRANAQRNRVFLKWNYASCDSNRD